MEHQNTLYKRSIKPLDDSDYERYHFTDPNDGREMGCLGRGKMPNITRSQLDAAVI